VKGRRKLTREEIAFLDGYLEGYFESLLDFIKPIKKLPPSKSPWSLIKRLKLRNVGPKGSV